MTLSQREKLERQKSLETPDEMVPLDPHRSTAMGHSTVVTSSVRQRAARNQFEAENPTPPQVPQAEPQAPRSVAGRYRGFHKLTPLEIAAEEAAAERQRIAAKAQVEDSARRSAEYLRNQERGQIQDLYDSMTADEQDFVSAIVRQSHAERHLWAWQATLDNLRRGKIV